MSLNDRKVEASIPVQSRVDVRKLAEMVLYFEGIGVRIKSMSMLVSYSVEVANKVLSNNGLLPDYVETVSEANRCLEVRDLYQPGMKGRSKKKLEAAMRFENLRVEDIEPKERVPREYNTLHNKQSVEPFTSNETAFVGGENSKPVPLVSTVEEEVRVKTKMAERLAELTKYVPPVRKDIDKSKVFDAKTTKYFTQDEMNKLERERMEDREKISTKDEVVDKNAKYKPKSKKEVDKDIEEIEEADKALYAMDMSGPKPIDD